MILTIVKTRVSFEQDLVCISLKQQRSHSLSISHMSAVMYLMCSNVPLNVVVGFIAPLSRPGSPLSRSSDFWPSSRKFTCKTHYRTSWWHLAFLQWKSMTSGLILCLQTRSNASNIALTLLLKNKYFKINNLYDKLIAINRKAQHQVQFCAHKPIQNLQYRH